MGSLFCNGSVYSGSSCRVATRRRYLKLQLRRCIRGSKRCYGPSCRRLREEHARQCSEHSLPLHDDVLLFVSSTCACIDCEPGIGIWGYARPPEHIRKIMGIREMVSCTSSGTD